MAKNPPRPRDTNQLAKLIADIATGEREDAPAPPPAPEGQVRGGKIGGKARANALTSEQRSEIAQKAARARWSKAAQR